MIENYDVLDERTLMTRPATQKSSRMPIPGAEGKARRDVAHAGFRRKGPIQNPKVEKSGTDVPVWVRTHKSPAEYAAHTARKAHREGDKTNVKALRKQLHQTGATKDSEVHDITVGSPKSKVKDPGQRARQFIGALKDVKGQMQKRGKGIATNTPTAISSTGKKRKRSDEEGAEQRGRIYKKLGMGERNPKTGVQMAKIGEGMTFADFMDLVEMRKLNEDAASYARRQANKQARGRSGKTSKYIEKSVGRVEKTPEGKWKVEKTTEKRLNPKASVGMFKAGRHGAGPGIQGGGHGGREMGYTPASHSTGGINRGKKKGEQTKAPEPKLNKFQRKSAVARAKHYRTGGSTMQSGLVGDRAAARIREKARKSFGAWSKEKG